MPRRTPRLPRPVCHLAPALLLALAAAAPAAAAVCDRPLVFGWEPAPPYQHRGPDGAVTGFDVEMVRAVLADMGCEMTLREVPWERHKAELRDGTIDVAAGIAKVGDRTEWLRYTAPYRHDVTALWVLAERLPELDFTRLADVAGRDVLLGVRRGYSYGGGYQELLATPGAERRLAAVDAEDQNLEKLLRGRIHGFLADAAVVRPLLRQQGLLERVVRHPAPVYEGESYVVFSKKSVDPAVVAAFDASLAKLRADGTYARIRARHLE